jgi:serine phosphatase RsbU (regulator of sigma subunit)
LFIFYKPKDIVSGDFYWFKKIDDDEFLIACADCTGHGVPGGFMSMICSEKLTLAATQTNEPSEILFLANNAVKESLRQENSNVNSTKDGMELCLLKINTRNKTVSYSGAKRLLWIMENGKNEITEIKPTKESIASDTEFNTQYQQSNLQLKKGDILYATSDGYADQFGGEKGKKFMTKQLKDLIIVSSKLPISEQKIVFEKTINDWKKGYEQVDDLLLIGILL